MQLKRFLSIISYVCVPLGLIIVSLLRPVDDTFGAFGNISLFLVLVIIFMKPIAIVGDLRWLRKLLAYRRQLGVAAFWCALFHGLLYVYDYELYQAAHYKGLDNYLLYGSFALGGMTILGLTSNNFALKRLKRNWKRIQYIAYPTFFLALLHVAMLEGEMEGVYGLGALFVILKTLEWKKIIIPWRAKLATL